MAKKDKTVYELGYHLLSIMSEEDVAKFVGSMKDKITSLGGEIISDQYPSLMKLAYQMIKEIDNKKVKFDSAYFGWVKFEIEADKIAEIDKMADTSLNVLRHLIIKTVRENTLYTPKVMKNSRKTTTSSSEENVEINEEEVDKKIDELIEDEE